MGNLLERFQPRLSIFASALALNSLWRQIKCSLLGVPDVARRMGLRDMTVYSWLKGHSRPPEPERITAFLIRFQLDLAPA
jgi:hypothetical protein